jgi:RHS repeat-associated protein
LVARCGQCRPAIHAIADNETGSSSALTYGGNPSNTYQLQSLVTTLNGTTTHNTSYAYNADGDRTSATDSIAGTTTTYGYDQFDRLTSYTKGSTSATYAYNGDGLRQSKTVNGTTTQETWDTAEGLPLLIQDGTTKEIDGPDGLPLEQITGNGTVSYDVHDQLGSTRELVASGGQIVTFYAYVAYGTLQTSGIYPGYDTNFRYAGQYTDPETGLQYLRARYYDPSSSQFLTVDPLAAQTGEPYGYSGGSPTNNIDPTGAMCIGSMPIPLTGDTSVSCHWRGNKNTMSTFGQLASSGDPGGTGCPQAGSIFPTATPVPTPPSIPLGIVVPFTPRPYVGPVATITPTPTTAQRQDQAQASACSGTSYTDSGGNDMVQPPAPDNPPPDVKGLRYSSPPEIPESKAVSSASFLAAVACAFPASAVDQAIGNIWHAAGSAIGGAWKSPPYMP